MILFRISDDGIITQITTVTVILENICGNHYADRLRAIFLFKADFNWWNKLVFYQQMLSQAGGSNLIPNEIFAKRGRQAMDTVLSKTFLTDVYKVLHHPAALGGCDLGDYYDRGALPPTGLGMWAIGAPPRQLE